MGVPFFYFPLNTPEWPFRIRSAFVVIIAILSIIFRHEPGVPWIWVGIIAEFTISTLIGGAGTPLTALAELCAVPLARRYEPGTPQQTAQIAQVGLAFVAVILFWWGDDEKIAACVIVAAHAGAVLLAAIGHCPVCFCYHMSVKFVGFPPKSTIDVCNDAVTDIDAEDNDNFKRVNPSAPERGVYKTPTGGISIEYAKKGDDYEREDWNPIKRTIPLYFTSALGTATFAVLWKLIQLDEWALGSTSLYPRIQHGWVDAFIIVAVVWTLLLFILYLAKIALHPRRFLKDCQKLDSFLLLSGLPCSFLMIAWVVSFYSDEGLKNLAIAIWWIAMPVQLFISVFGFGRFVSQPLGVESATPVMLYPSFGLMLIGLVAPYVLYKQDQDDYGFSYYGDVLMAFYGSGIAFAMILPVTLFRMMFYFSEYRIRPTLGMYTAIFALGAWGCLINGTTDLFLFRIGVFGATIFFFFVCAAGVNMYYMERNFHMNYWFFIFPSLLLALVSVMYWDVVRTDGAHAMSIGFVAAATWGYATTLVYTVTYIVRRQLWAPVKKFYPLTINKTFHYYFRGIVPKLNRLSEKVDLSNENSVNTFIETLELFLTVLREHSEYEERVLFPVYRGYFPDVTNSATEDHQRDAATLQKMLDGIQTIRTTHENSEKSAAVQMLQGEINDLGKELLTHVQWEDENLEWILRKFINVDQQKDILRDIIKSVPLTTWRRIIPHMMHHISNPAKREKLIRCFLWAMPESSQMVSVWVQDALSPYFLRRTIMNIPEIIPRNHWNYRPYQ